MWLGVVEEDCAGVGSDAVLVAHGRVDGAVQGAEGDLSPDQSARLPELREEIHAVEIQMIQIIYFHRNHRFVKFQFHCVSHSPGRTPGCKEVDDDGAAGDDIGEVSGDEGLHGAGLRRQPRELDHVLDIVLAVVQLPAAAQLEQRPARELGDVEVAADLGQLGAVHLAQPLPRDEGGNLLEVETVSDVAIDEVYQPRRPHVIVQPPSHLTECFFCCEFWDLRKVL